MGKGKSKDGAEKAKDKRRDEKIEGAHAENPAKDAKPEKTKKAKKAKKAPKVKAKPRGMRWVSPYLTVKDVKRSIEWYEKAFGFEAVVIMPGPEDTILHAELRHEKGVIMMGPESPDGRSRSPGKDGASVSMYCYCRDVDALAASAKAAGATIAEEPEDQFWGDRTCFLVDPDGHQWMFATHIFDMEECDEEDYEDGPCGDTACEVCSCDGEDEIGGGDKMSKADAKDVAPASGPAAYPAPQASAGAAAAK